MEFEKHCWALVDLDALAHNFRRIAAHAAPAKVCAVVKAGAYGHADGVVCKALQDAGAEWFAVSCLAEALHLRAGGVTGDILILGHTDPAFAARLMESDLTQAVFSGEYARALSDRAAAAGGRVKAHLKVDTGMGRLGFDARRAEAVERCVEELAGCWQLPGLAVGGVFQHFAVADSHDAGDVAYTAGQHGRFLQVLAGLRARGLDTGLAHCCNSAALTEHPEWGMDLVRPGIILYGCDASDEVHFEGLRPVLRLMARVSQVKEIEAGQSVSYGRLYTARSPRRVATLCVGYADGYPRSLSGQGVCSIHGQSAPVIGRVCMDQLLVDVTGLENVKAGDEACVFGGAGCDTIEEVARKAGTIPYEVMCALALRVPRVYLRGGKAVALADYLNQTEL